MWIQIKPRKAIYTFTSQTLIFNPDPPLVSEFLDDSLHLFIDVTHIRRQSLIKANSCFYIFPSSTRLFDISGGCFLFLAVSKTSHPCPRWRTKSERRHVQVQHEWNKLILVYNTDEQMRSLERGFSSAPRLHETQAPMKENKEGRLVWFHAGDEDDEMRGGEGMRAPLCPSVVQCPAGSTPLH